MTSEAEIKWVSVRFADEMALPYSLFIPFEQLNRGNGRSTAIRVPGVTRKACKHADQGAT